MRPQAARSKGRIDGTGANRWLPSLPRLIATGVAHRATATGTETEGATATNRRYPPPSGADRHSTDHFHATSGVSTRRKSVGRNTWGHEVDQGRSGSSTLRPRCAQAHHEYMARPLNSRLEGRRGRQAPDLDGPGGAGPNVRPTATRNRPAHVRAAAGRLTVVMVGTDPAGIPARSGPPSRTVTADSGRAGVRDRDKRATYPGAIETVAARQPEHRRHR